MFRRSRLIVLFDLVVFTTGTALLLTMLGWTNVEATVVQAENVCEYSILANQSWSTDPLASLPVISGKCVETEEAAKQLIKAGYNHVAKGWMATAMIKNEAEPTEFYLFDAGYQATNKSWELFLWGERQLEIGCTIRLNRTSTGYIVIPPTYPLKISDIFWALYQTIVGLILSFGTLAIYIFQYLRTSSQKRD